jgi:hypothetical protein
MEMRGHERLGFSLQEQRRRDDSVRAGLRRLGAGLGATTRVTDTGWEPTSLPRTLVVR